MAIYRLHRRTWDKGFTGLSRKNDGKSSKAQLNRVQAEEAPQSTSQHPQGNKRSRVDHSLTFDDDTKDNAPREPVGTHKRRQITRVKQKGISSGLSIVVKRRTGRTEVKQTVSGTGGDGKSKEQTYRWWGTLSK